jgi:hypothetical protein
VGRYSLNSNGGPNCDVRCSQRHASGRTGVPSGHEGATLWNDIGRICKRKEANLRKLRLELAPLAKPADDDTISRWRHSQVCGLLRIWDVHVSALCERGLVGRVVRSDLSVERGNLFGGLARTAPRAKSPTDAITPIKALDAKRPNSS